MTLPERRPMANTDTTSYGNKIAGDRGNHGLAVRFDITTGDYLGISQYDDGRLADRVLLSPAQVQALLKFLGARR